MGGSYPELAIWAAAHPGPLTAAQHFELAEWPEPPVRLSWASRPDIPSSTVRWFLSTETDDTVAGMLACHREVSATEALHNTATGPRKAGAALNPHVDDATSTTLVRELTLFDYGPVDAIIDGMLRLGTRVDKAATVAELCRFRQQFALDRPFRTSPDVWLLWPASLWKLVLMIDGEAAEEAAVAAYVSHIGPNQDRLEDAPTGWGRHGQARVWFDELRTEAKRLIETVSRREVSAQRRDVELRSWWSTRVPYLGPAVSLFATEAGRELCERLDQAPDGEIAAQILRKLAVCRDEPALTRLWEDVSAAQPATGV